MVNIDFTQMYPTLAAAMMILTGLYSTLVERRGYVSRNLDREAKWAKSIGIIWIAAGLSLYVAAWVWRNFMW
ncbi:hypothetical protein LLE49_01810 [Alicyclobacillus tolerans]|uniref:CLC_0170 family protein n=1 Tax=Alicyclobacillus tolerans TaxID=90970 RepID=UPI001F4243F6|nr:CLC_0170 family protein [Alicyclobacillus tolerans]MCF8563478.1 hypothetical protein [Alicyclobacillus tolerans]